MIEAIEPLVLGRDDCVAQVHTHVFSVDHSPELIASPCKGVTASVQQGHRATGPAVYKIINRRQRRGVVENADADQQADDNSAAPENAPE